jgi:hypothetical protein
VAKHPRFTGNIIRTYGGRKMKRNERKNKKTKQKKEAPVKQKMKKK